MNGWSLNQWAVCGIGLLLLLSVSASWLKRTAAIRGFYLTCCGLCAALATCALAALLTSATPLLVQLPIGLPLGHTLLGWDALSATFAALINAVIALVSWYAVGYGSHEHEPQRVLPFYAAFLAGMNLILMANDAFSFLVGWEFMSLASWALVVSQDRDASNRHAGFVYLVMAFAGTLCLLLLFGMLAGSAGGYSFEQIRAAHLPAVTAAFSLLLALAGTGSKAGLFPLHAWLPLAHPAAPSHVSALMSGVMTKVAIYGFMRFAFDLAVPGAAGAWLGAALIVLGAVTAVYAVLAAMFETDIKRSLAFSTIENIGVIFASLGLALAFQASGLAAAAALALTTALLHAVNHAFMKSLLFMGAGAVVATTGERQLDAYGGLARRMPKTMAAMLVGSLAIAALPPFNGFVSEWLLFQSVLASPALPGWLLKMIVPAAGAAFALAAALAAGVVVRLFGITFLGRARSSAARDAQETDFFSSSAMAIAALSCVLLGALPVLAIEPLQYVVQQLLGTTMPIAGNAPWGSLLPLPTSASSYNGLTILIFLLMAATLAALVLRFFASGALRRGPTWDCGFPDPQPATQYSAQSFAQPIKRVFGASLFHASEQVDMPAPGEQRTARIDTHWYDLPWHYVYLPLANAVLWLADKLNQLQFLTIRRYLLMVFVALLILLTVVTAWR